MTQLEKIFASFEAMTPAEAAEHDAEIKALEEQQTARERDNAYRKSGAPERYWNESLDTFLIKNDMQKSAAAAAAGFIRCVKTGVNSALVMLGKAGTGKTHLACSIIRETGGRYRTAPEIVEEIRRAKSFNSPDTEADILARYAKTSVLIIDEIGRGISAADEKYMLFMLINARYNTRRPTVLISNHTKKDFLAYIGTAAADRLVENAVMVEFNGESYRLQLRGKNGN